MEAKENTQALKSSAAGKVDNRPGEDKEKSYRAYRLAYCAAKVVLGLVYPVRVVGRENVPEGSAMVCANHSSWVDPVLMAFAISMKEQVCFMGKVELFKNKLIGGIFRAIGAVPVDRESADLEAVKTALRRLTSGRKVGIFPEGTRSAEEDTVTPKVGAIRIAEQARAPIVPVYIPRKKKLFRPMTIVIGQPVTILRQRERRTHEEYENLAEGLMNTIKSLGPAEPVGRIGED